MRENFHFGGQPIGLGRRRALLAEDARSPRRERRLGESCELRELIGQVVLAYYVVKDGFV